MKRTRALSVIRWPCGSDAWRSPCSSSTHTSTTRASPSPAALLGGRASAASGLASEVDLQVAVGDLVRLAEVDGVAPLEQQRAVAEAVQRAHVVGDEHDRAPFVAHLVEDVEALLLEGGVADREHLVDEQDVGVDLDRDREGEAHVHPRGVVLELQLLELAQFGEVDDGVVARACLARARAPS